MPASGLQRRGFATHTPRRTFARPSRKRRLGCVALPIEGERAAPDMAIAAGRLRSRWRRAERPRSNSLVGTPPTSGPPTAWLLNVKLVTRRPGGVAPGSDTLAAAHTTSVGQALLVQPGGPTV